jgi:hypothetical protein
MTLTAPILLASILLVGPEVPIGEPPRDAQPYVQRIGDVAAGDDLALVVWRDGTALRGARVDRDGNTLDASPLLIAYAPWEGAWVARGTTNWLVVTWQVDRLEATIVEDDGTVRQSMLITDRPAWPRVAFDGSTYLVAWHSPTQMGRIFAARISAAGDLVENEIPLTGTPLGIIDLLAAPGGGFVLVGQYGEVVATHFDPELHAVSRTTLHPENIAYDAIAALEPNVGVAIAWSAGDAVYLKRHGRETISVPATHADDFVTVGGTLHVIVRSHESTTIRTLDGTVVREFPAPAASRAGPFGDGVLLATWDGDVHVTLLDAALQTAAPERLVYVEPRLQTRPVVAVANGLPLIVWCEGEGDTTRIVGKICDGAPFFIAEGRFPEVATDGRDFLVAWHDGVTHVRRILRDSRMSEPADASGWTWGDTCLTWTGSDYVLAYITMDAFPRAHIREVVAQRIERDGTFSGNPITVSGTRAIDNIACASTRSTTLFAWAEELSDVVDAATLSRAGTVSRFHVGTGTATSVATAGDGFVVAWPHDGPGSASSWASVSEGGTVGLPHTIESRTIDVAARTTGYLLLYGTNPLVARTLDREGNPNGPEVVIAEDASEPAFSRGVLVYQRDVDILSQPRWQAFRREIVEPPRRRAMRH